MTKSANNVAITIKDLSTSAENREVQITISAKAELFILSDLLVKEKAIEDLDSLLKISARKAVANYILSGRTFLKSVSAKKGGKLQPVKELAGQDKRTCAINS